MKRATMAPGTITIGLDLGDRYSHFCLLDATGRVQGQGRVATTPAAPTLHAVRPSATRRGDRDPFALGEPPVGRVRTVYND